MIQVIAGLFILLLAGCRNDPAPRIEICILDGHGGGDCVAADGNRNYRPPSKMLNYWATSQPDMANFSSWCYKARPSDTKLVLDQLRLEILK